MEHETRQAMSERHILVVEDEPGVVGMVARLARSCGYRASSTASVEGFIKVFEHLRPSLLLVDLKLAGGDGVEVFSFLARVNARTPVIIISGFGDQVLSSSAHLARCLGLTVAGIFSKPLDVPAFLTTLDTWAEREMPLPADQATSENPVRRLRHAIDRGELMPYFQPQIDLESGQVVGVEALARWQQPDGRVELPSEFIPLAEENGLMLDLTMSLLDQALERHRAWRSEGLDLSLSVNISAGLLECRDFPDQVDATLARHGVPAECLVLEVTEQSAIRDPVRAMETLTRLCLSQVSLSLDDLGTAHSCLAELRRIPLRETKIDTRFVLDLADAAQSRVIVKAIAALSHELGLRVVAEGVADVAALEYLRQVGVDVGQGYLFSRPLPADEFLTWLRARSGPQSKLTEGIST